ncbi:hypothetical protein [Dokdonella koreensis]|uniref:hypothetical protein n=1 Tax=Dokdonella koreensis TaxID=323415 RepID=UPI001237196B|nr:hypothetical protein [Dokdonella koreensis]
MLIDDHRATSNLASLSLFLLMAAFVLILVNEYAFKVPAAQKVMASVFGGAMLFFSCRHDFCYIPRGKAADEAERPVYVFDDYVAFAIFGDIHLAGLAEPSAGLRESLI